MEESVVLDAKSAAGFLNISVSFLWELRARYKIPFVKIGNRTLWLKEDLEKWLRLQRVMSPEAEERLMRKG
ncbi:MAG: helix-turn-helix domain-containing protein [Elusimicrobia bacterium]|nr:helix-turn-helix domain-containing protein [Elusimicrobiota bacterium]